jgi:hypothetical protein
MAHDKGHRGEGHEEEAAADTFSPAVGIALDGARHDPALRDNIARFLHRQE